MGSIHKSQIMRPSFGGSGGMAKRFVKMLDAGIMPDRTKMKRGRRVVVTAKDARLK
jgi:hypothetical protein